MNRIAALEQPRRQPDSQRNEQDVFNMIEGVRHNLDLPIINEEASGTNETEEHVQYKLAENYPLR